MATKNKKTITREDIFALLAIGVAYIFFGAPGLNNPYYLWITQIIAFILGFIIIVFAVVLYLRNRKQLKV